MKRDIALIIICITLIGYQCNNRVISKVHPKKKQNPHGMLNSLGAQKQEPESEDYFGFDTLLIKEYVSDNGHKVKLEGSKSKGIYRISVKSKQGNKRKFQIAEKDDWHMATHFGIIWDNDNFICGYYGCGTECWGCKILPLNDTGEILDIELYFYIDSVDNIVAYLDTSDWQTIVVKNFSNNNSIIEKFRFCDEAANPIWVIDTVYQINENKLLVKYKDSDCILAERVIDINVLKN